ncbi:hypothetical protein [Agromyces arachidis]|uniref:hypothetical protein n=1 Tax=Agromyces arachidis TaxID=766966 RepID=UPI004057C740
MRFEITYDDRIWSVMPDPAAGADDLWVAEQRLRFSDGLFAAHLDALEAAAREALARRRTGGVTTLFFRPLGVPATGVLHVALADAVLDEREGPLAWLPPGVEPRTDPVVTPFETEVACRGHRLAYVTDRDDAGGEPLAGLAYGFAIDDRAGYVFSELARTDVTGLMQSHADAVVGSLRLVA